MEHTVISREEAKKIERKAKSLMLTKEIPQGKVDIVRSIMSNAKLFDEERNKAIIELLQNLPDRKPEPQKSPRKVGIQNSQNIRRSTPFVSSGSPYAGPTQSGLYVSDLYIKYKSKGLFKKRWLINTKSRFGIGFKKRLVPSKKLLRLAREIGSFQDKIITRLPSVITSILDDPMIDSPAVFNYLRAFHRWIMEIPFSNADFEQTKWMDQRHFEQQLKPFCVWYLSFRELDTAAKENIILAVETKLRDMDDLKKEQIHQIEPASARSDKEKRNLEREKVIYDFMMTLRSFLPSIDPSEGTLCQYLKHKYDFASLEELCLTLMEGLVFQRDLTTQELVRYYGIKAPAVSQTEWDYSIEYIKRIGKDEEAKRRRQLEKLTETLDVLEERYQLVNLRYDVFDLVLKAFDEQWRIVNKRRQDSSDIYEKDFFMFLDESLNYFTKGYLPFLDGTALTLSNEQGESLSSPVFSRAFFESELNLLSNILTDLLRIKTETPNLVMTHAELKKLVAGQIPSMSNMELIIKQLSSVFYDLGLKLQSLLDSHRKWVLAGGSVPITAPLLHPASAMDEDLIPIPFYSFRLLPSDESHPAYKYLTGRLIVSESLKDGIVNILTAFCFQFAYECFDRKILSDLEYRKELKKKMQTTERI
jgi:hypothetical protein